MHTTDSGTNSDDELGASVIGVGTRAPPPRGLPSSTLSSSSSVPSVWWAEGRCVSVVVHAEGHTLSGTSVSMDAAGRPESSAAEGRPCTGCCCC